MTEPIQKKVEDIVAELRRKGRPVPRKISEIPHLPCRSWNDLQDGWKAGRLRLQRFAYKLDRDIFDLFASSGERLMLTVYTSATYLVPIACVGLAFVHSWWWLLGIIFVVVGFRTSKAFYNRVIYRAAFDSETFFCFLYFVRQVSVTTTDYKKSYFWNTDDEPKPGADAPVQPIATAERLPPDCDAPALRAGPAFREFEKEITAWPQEEAALALQLLDALFSGDKFAINRLSQKLTHVQFVIIHSTMKRMKSEAEGQG